MTAPYLQAGRWRLRCPECSETLQSPERLHVYELLDAHRIAEHGVDGMGS